MGKMEMLIKNSAQEYANVTEGKLVKCMLADGRYLPIKLEDLDLTALGPAHDELVNLLVSSWIEPGEDRCKARVYALYNSGGTVVSTVVPLLKDDVAYVGNQSFQTLNIRVKATAVSGQLP